MVKLNPMNICQKCCVHCIIYHTLFIIGEQIWFVNIKLLITINCTKINLNILDFNRILIILSIVFEFINIGNKFNNKTYFIYIFIIFSYLINLTIHTKNVFI